MPRYKVLRDSYINHVLVEEGSEVDYDGLPSDNLEPTCAEGKKQAAAFIKADAERRAGLKIENADSTVAIDPKAIAEAMVSFHQQMSATATG